MIDNGRYKVDDLRSSRPIRKKVCRQFFVVSDLNPAERGKARDGQVATDSQTLKERGICAFHCVSSLVCRGAATTSPDR